MTNKQVFSVGDVVRCINAQAVKPDQLVAGQEYEVTETFVAYGTNFLAFKHSHGWDVKRFTLVRPASPAEPAKGDLEPSPAAAYAREFPQYTGYSCHRCGKRITAIGLCAACDAMLMRECANGHGDIVETRAVTPKPDKYAEHRERLKKQLVNNMYYGDSNLETLLAFKMAEGERGQRATDRLLAGLRSEQPKPRRPNPKYDGTKWQEWPAGGDDEP